MKLTLQIIVTSFVLAYSLVNAEPFEFTENQIDCQLKLEKFKWLKQQETNSSPNYSKSFESHNVKGPLQDKIIKNLIFELILKDQFKFKITQEMVQSELNRITAETQKPTFLREIFALFDYNPNKIANCLVRPQLIERTLTKQYYWASSKHASTKSNAEKELEKIIAHNSKQLSIAVIHDQKFSSNKNNLESSHEVFHENIPELSRSIKQQSGLIEKKTAYEHQQVISENNDSLTVRTFSWNKKPINNWLNDLQTYYYKTDIELNLIKISNQNFYLNKITNNPEFVKNENSSIYGDYWKNNYFIPHGNGHQVWTGTELIVWSSEGPYSGAIYNPTTDTWRPMSGINAPVEIGISVSYWTGSEMLVWGSNIYADTPFNSGGFYNPVTDTWRPMSSNGSPKPRDYYSAEWTGDELIIWGGYEEISGYQSTGFRYSLINDSWTPMSNIGAPAPRYKASATFTGEDIIIWGGYLGLEFRYDNSGAIYNLANDTWAPMSVINAPVGRGRHFDVWTGEEFLIWGGGTSYSSRMNTGGVYNPQTNSWRAISQQNVPTGRIWGNSNPIWTGSELIVWGGDGVIGESNEGAKYQVSTDTWSTITLDNAPAPRITYSAVWTGDEMIIWGGMNLLSNGGIYNPKTNSWRNMLHYNQPGWVIGESLYWTGYEMILLTLRSDRPGRKYNPTLNYWYDINYENAPEYRSLYSTVWTGEEFIIWGGRCHTASCRKNKGSIYNPNLNEWFTLSNSNSPIMSYDHAAIWTGDQMVVWGGRGDDDRELYSGGIYNPTNDSWSLISDIGSPFMHTYDAFWTGNDIIIWGRESFSNNGNTVFTNGYLFDPFNNIWSEISDVNEPSYKQYSKAIWTGEKMIIWGGELGSVSYNTGAIYDPSNDLWTVTSTNNAPNFIREHQAIWTGTDMIVWDTNDNGIFNPVTNTWRNMKDHDVYGDIVWAGSEMYVWGHHGTNSHRLNIYVPQTELIFINGFESDVVN